MRLGFLSRYYRFWKVRFGEEEMLGELWNSSNLILLVEYLFNVYKVFGFIF